MSGTRAGSPGPRERILAAALGEFAWRCYDGATTVGRRQRDLGFGSTEVKPSVPPPSGALTGKERS